jgi:hypothetical protein
MTSPSSVESGHPPWRLMAYQSQTPDRLTPDAVSAHPPVRTSYSKSSSGGAVTSSGNARPGARRSGAASTSRFSTGQGS